MFLPASLYLPGSLAHASLPLDQTSICFRDQMFLNFVGGFLSPASVFDYFANSPFYDRSCNNEKLRMEGVHPLDMQRLRQVSLVAVCISGVNRVNLGGIGQISLQQDQRQIMNVA